MAGHLFVFALPGKQTNAPHSTDQSGAYIDLLADHLLRIAAMGKSEGGKRKLGRFCMSRGDGLKELKAFVVVKEFDFVNLSAGNNERVCIGNGSPLLSAFLNELECMFPNTP